MVLATTARHLAHNSVGYFALVVATSGTAYAAATIGSADVVDDSLRSIDISNDTTAGGGLTGADIRPDALTGADIQEQSLATVRNADKLDGLDSSAFVQGRGAVEEGAAAIGAGNGFAQIVLATADPAIVVAYNCPADLTQNGVLVFANNSSDLANVFSDNGGTSPEYRQVPGIGGRWDQFAAATGEHVTFQIQIGGPKIMTIEVFSVHRAASNDCHVAALATTHR